MTIFIKFRSVYPLCNRLSIFFQPPLKIDAEMGKAIGGISLLNNSPSNLKVEIGDMWFHPSYQVGSNHEALLIETIYLLLGNLFSQRYRRVEWLIDVGDPSRGLATSQLGFQ